MHCTRPRYAPLIISVDNGKAKAFLTVIKEAFNLFTIENEKNINVMDHDCASSVHSTLAACLMEIFAQNVTKMRKLFNIQNLL